jgi:2-oxoglutarate dehydrogenase complex dehydrogenase (E1) component-like enzyme
MVAPLMAAIAASTTVAADAQPRVTAVAGVLLPVAIRRRAADPRTVAADPRMAVDRRMAAAVAVAADMGGNNALDFFPA